MMQCTDPDWARETGRTNMAVPPAMMAGAATLVSPWAWFSGMDDEARQAQARRGQRLHPPLAHTQRQPSQRPGPAIGAGGDDSATRREQA